MRWRAMALAFAVVACSPEKDIVAHATDSGSVQDAPKLPIDAGEEDSGDTGVRPSSCSPDAAPIYLADKTGGLFSYVPAKGTLTSVADLAMCKLTGPVVSLAVARNGLLWLVDSQGAVYVMDPSLPACKPASLLLAQPAYIAFLEANGTESLYAATGDGALVAIDPVSLVRSPVGKLGIANLLALTSSSDGRLFAITPIGKPDVVAIEISPGNASTVSKLLLSDPVLLTVTTATSWGKKFLLFSATAAYEFTTTSSTVTGTTSFPPGLTHGDLAAGSSPCALP